MTSADTAAKEHHGGACAAMKLTRSSSLTMAYNLLDLLVLLFYASSCYHASNHPCLYKIIFINPNYFCFSSRMVLLINAPMSFPLKKP
jgi:hypothetical protein